MLTVLRWTLSIHALVGPCSVLAGPEESTSCEAASAGWVSDDLVQVQFSSDAKWVDNEAGLQC